MDLGHLNGNNNQPRNQTNQQRSDTPQDPAQPNRLAVTESAKLPAPKPLPPARPLASHIRQPNHSGLPQPQTVPMHSPLDPPDGSPPKQHRERANSRSSDATGFWPESQIDSQFGSPTTHRSERYDAVISNRLRSPPPTMPAFENLHRPIDDNVPFIIGKDGSMRVLGSNQAQALPATNNGMPPPRMEQPTQQDAYLSEPIYNSPMRRPTKIALRPTAVRRLYEPSAFKDEEVFSDSPTYQSPQPYNNLRRVEIKDKVQEPRRSTIFQEDEEVEGSLASDYPVSEDDHGTPRASHKRTMPREPVLLESSLPAAARNQRSKSRKRRRDSCDYADDELAGMTYFQLQKQPFDDDPAKTSLQPVGPLTGDSLPVKLDHFKGQREVDQKQFFKQMKVDDWERSGDWFLEQFGEVAKKLKEARRNKRAIVKEFEDEIASREEAVRVRTENITKKLNQIKHKGEDMLADKEV